MYVYIPKYICRYNTFMYLSERLYMYLDLYILYAYAHVYTYISDKT